MNRFFSLPALFCAAAVLITSGGNPARAEEALLQEDFTSWEFRDAVLTTADWDTLAGRLQLFPVGLDSLSQILNAGSATALTLGPEALFIGLDGPDGLASYDVSDPTSPLQLDLLATADGVRDIVVEGSYAFVSVGPPGILSVNIADPTDLIAAGQVDLDGFTFGMDVSGNRLYVAQAQFGVGILDISAPATPALINSVAPSDWARDVAVMGSTLLLADNNAGLTLMNLADPDNPTLMETIDLGGLCYAVEAQEDRAFVAAGSAGLVIMDVADPGDPQELGRLAFPGEMACRHVVAQGDTVFAAVSSQGMYVVDVTVPAEPTIIGSWQTSGTANQVTAGPTEVWVAAQSGGVFGFEVNPAALDTEANRVQSLTLIGPGEPVTRARLSASTTDSVRFELTVDGGAHWHHILPGSDWLDFDEPGEDFRWRATLVQTGEDLAPTCDEIILEFFQLHGYGTITAVADVPDDTGGQVRLAWSPSRFDAPGEDYTVTGYSIYRRYDDDPGAQLAYPDGSWDFLATIPADMETEYAAVVPTLADSTVTGGMAWSVFFVRTRTSTPGTFFDSPPDSGYSVNNLQPAPPTGFLVNFGDPEGTRLTWDPPAFGDFAHFRIYRASQPGIPPQPGTLYQVTSGTEWLDSDPGLWHYDLTVVNLAGQESEPAAVHEISPVPGHEAGLLVHPAAPNPFNPRTWLSFSVPADGARIRLVIYDARGRLVRRLADRTFGAGDHRVMWDGTDSRGRAVGSGVYHALVRSDASSQVVKMLLLR